MCNIFFGVLLHTVSIPCSKVVSTGSSLTIWVIVTLFHCNCFSKLCVILREFCSLLTEFWNYSTPLVYLLSLVALMSLLLYIMALRLFDAQFHIFWLCAPLVLGSSNVESNKGVLMLLNICCLTTFSSCSLWKCFLICLLIQYCSKLVDLNFHPVDLFGEFKILYICLGCQLSICLRIYGRIVQTKHCPMHKIITFSHLLGIPEWVFTATFILENNHPKLVFLFLISFSITSFKHLFAQSLSKHLSGRGSSFLPGFSLPKSSPDSFLIEGLNSYLSPAI